jgi:formiminotetrahydrofolate cyclodeaminase
MAGDSLSDQAFAVLLETFAGPSATPGGISVACLAAAAAAALVERCGAAAAPAELQGAGRRATQLRGDLVAAADADVEVLHALAKAAPGDRAAAAARASGPAMALRAAAVEVVELARMLERDGAPRLRGEARCAALLAGAAADTATAVIAANEALAGGA